MDNFVSSTYSRLEEDSTGFIGLLMQDFFIIGSENPAFLLIHDKLCDLPGFQGIVLPQGNIFKNKHIPELRLAYLENVKKVSLGSFLLYAKKNAGVTLVSCYDFPSGWEFTRKLLEYTQRKIRLCNFYEYCVERKVPVVFVPADEERTIILGAEKEWTEFRNHLTDDFSKYTLECYLAAYENQDPRLMFPVCMGFEHIYFNRVSRKIGMVPGVDEIYVDVGALDGDTVTGFIDCAGTYQAIYAFEPTKSVFDILKQKEFFLNNFVARNVAVSNFSGTLDFIVTENLLSARPAVLDAVQTKIIEKVSCAKLDDEIDEATLLKIEVEGHEVAVIEGATNLIKKCRPDMIVQAYHYPLDPIRILDAVTKIHKYKYVALRFYMNMYISSLLFSDRAPFA